MAESEVESSEYYEDDDQEFENEVDLLTHQSVYNTLSDLFIEGGYCQIKNDEKEKRCCDSSLKCLRPLIKVVF